MLRRYPVELGSMLYTLVEPARDRALEYNRWYEGDHFFESLREPGAFAGRRFACTRELKQLRYPDGDAVVPSRESGSLLSVYWLLDGGRYEEWGAKRANELHAEGRMFPERAHVHTQLYDLDWFVARDDDGVTPELALDHPFPGMVTVVGETDDHDALDRWYRETYLERLLPGSPIQLCLSFRPRALLPSAPGDVPKLPADPRRWLHLSFLDVEPATCWNELFAGEGAAVEAAGVGTVVFASPFVPTIPGTDTYMDRLW
jgi:hypothetical protein